ncbi:MAG: CGNR zinc finger domain-containing protein [Chloroflexota bacterium]|nr:CGNR zinc finger domain-containing protein [Chloroflexota bacterium]
MDALCLDILNSDWHDYRGTGKDEDRLLKPGWLEQLVARWDLSVAHPPDANIIAALQKLRFLMQRMVQTFLQEKVPSEKDIAALNTYLDAAPSRKHLVREDEHYHLQQVPLNNDWQWVMGEVAASFATLLAHHDTSRIKQCENPNCRWVYYDESWNQSRRWCEEPCANLMRVRRFRARSRERNEET